jgi:hypothetical protein
MIYCNLICGLGNKLFMIAASYALALDNSDDIQISNTHSSARSLNIQKLWFDTILKDVPMTQSISSKKTSIYREKSHLYNKIPYVKNMQIVGYFQSSKYFDHYRDKIVELFTSYKKTVESDLNKIMEKTTKPKIGIHIRRGDYLLKQNQDCHNVLSQSDYYLNALTELSNKLNISNINELNNKYSFYIFSDSIEWCKEWEFLKQFKDIEFISDNSITDVHELYLMSMCDHNIIANSSFSWWGVYLSDNIQNKVVIAPKKWFVSKENGGDGPYEWDTIYCDNWIIV